MPATLKLPLAPVIVPAEEVPSPQLIVAEYALGVALVFGSVMVATVPPTVEPAGPENERPPAAVVSTISVLNETVGRPRPREVDTDHGSLCVVDVARAAVAHGREVASRPTVIATTSNPWSR